MNDCPIIWLGANLWVWVLTGVVFGLCIAAALWLLTRTWGVR